MDISCWKRFGKKRCDTPVEHCPSRQGQRRCRRGCHGEFDDEAAEAVDCQADIGRESLLYKDPNNILVISFSILSVCVSKP